MSPDADVPMTADDTGGAVRPAGAESTAPTLAIGEVEPVIGEEVIAPSRSPEERIDEVDRLLDAIEQALGALDDGSYGRCATCESAIDATRLAEDPLARECRSCASEAATLSE